MHKVREHPYVRCHCEAATRNGARRGQLHSERQLVQNQGPHHQPRGHVGVREIIQTEDDCAI